MPENTTPLFSNLVDTKKPQLVIDEVKTIIRLIDPGFDFTDFDDALETALQLFCGNYPGYRGCTTDFHNQQHTMDVLLAMARLIHGAACQKITINSHDISLGLLAAVFHDIGYIQKSDDIAGTGAKYTMVHIDRGIDFMSGYMGTRPFLKSDFSKCRSMILCTGFNIAIKDIPFESTLTELLGQMLGSADLLGQMADRLYLEKLLLLFNEFKEGKVGNYATELDLLKNTRQFFSQTEMRLATVLANVKRFMVSHFAARWDINKDLYDTAIQKNKQYLDYVLKNHENQHRDFLRRDNIVRRLNDEGK
jgi:hypothetical protein